VCRGSELTADHASDHRPDSAGGAAIVATSDLATDHCANHGAGRCADHVRLVLPRVDGFRVRGRRISVRVIRRVPSPAAIVIVYGRGSFDVDWPVDIYRPFDNHLTLDVYGPFNDDFSNWTTVLDHLGLRIAAVPATLPSMIGEGGHRTDEQCAGRKHLHGEAEGHDDLLSFSEARLRFALPINATAEAQSTRQVQQSVILGYIRWTKNDAGVALS
jgi:hypothetical protein